MCETDNVKRDYSKYRIEKAENNLNDAQLLYNAGSYESANNRAYYCIFHSIRALFALDGIDFKKHSAVISEFRKRYIKAGIFNVELSDIVGEAFEIRNDSDYQDMVYINKEEALAQIENAKTFFNTISEYIQKQDNL